MQKKLIALAIAGLASSAAFAQSNVTISGNLDIGYRSTSFGTTTLMDAKTAALGNGSSTSSIVFSGTEDIGNGMKVGFRLNTEPAFGATNANFINSESYLELSGNFGSLKLGTVNNAALIAGAAVAQPFGTAIGGGYSANFGRLSRTTTIATAAGTTPVAILNGEGETATGTSGGFLVRNSSSLKYTTPSFSGFTASLQYAAKNNDANAAAASNTPSTVEIGLNYNNGPLNVAYVNYALNQAGVTNILTANEKMTHNMLAANYTFGPATVYGGWTSSKQSGLAAVGADSRSWNIALKYAVSGALNLMANIVKVDDKLVGNQDRDLTGLGLDYALSKRSTAYGRYETGDNDKRNTGTVDGKFTRWSVGLRHTF